MRYLCVHGHFYQPPRENPWLEAIERQADAYPFHDWNERVNAECYAPNAFARLLADDGLIERLINNYARIGFDVGPTLLAWMEQHAPDVYAAILEADRRSQERYGGHGSALAQAYNHAILPLANRRDKETQVLWGIRDFEHRFRRRPHGMWLPETAADLETLDVLAQHGIRFTVLAPHQASRVRPLGARAWRDVSNGEVDPRMPYEVRLPGGRSIAVFFYDGAISQAVAFEGLLNSGETFAQRLLGGFDDRDGPQLVHIATDGESYGHHHRHGEMALGYALHHVEAQGLAQLTNYSQYLELHPPTHEAEILEETSWSCAHGIERWRADCGCADGQVTGAHQVWRAPLRAALDWLRDELAPRSEDLGRSLFKDVWAARDDYIRLVLDRSDEAVATFLDLHASNRLDDRERIQAIELLELQRHALLMYTSCGWFFDELSRIETVQVLHYAARAVQLAEDLFGQGHLEAEFLDRLAAAESHLAAVGDGRSLYERAVRSSVVDLEQVAAHWAISALFDRYGRRARVYCYAVVREDHRVSEAGRAKLGVARVEVESSITGASEAFEVAVLHLGDHNIACGVRPQGDHAAYGALRDGLEAAFAKADFPAALRIVDAQFPAHAYSLATLFRDEQQRILRTILDATMADVEAAYRNIYRGRAPLMRYLSDLGATPPLALRRAAEVVLNADLREAIGDVAGDPGRLQLLLDEAKRYGVDLDSAGLAHAYDTTIERVAARVGELLADLPLFDSFGDEEAEFFARIEALVDLSHELPFDTNLWRAQNVFYGALRDFYPGVRSRAEAGDEAAARWVAHFRRLGTKLRMRVV